IKYTSEIFGLLFTNIFFKKALKIISLVSVLFSVAEYLVKGRISNIWQNGGIQNSCGIFATSLFLGIM
ncbi:unnamed protein product, partial [Larinioides sclopetarius]